LKFSTYSPPSVGISSPRGHENFKSVCLLRSDPRLSTARLLLSKSKLKTNSYTSSGTRLKNNVWWGEVGTYATGYSRRRPARGIVDVWVGGGMDAMVRVGGIGGRRDIERRRTRRSLGGAVSYR
jgi:hypothetical protein